MAVKHQKVIIPIGTGFTPAQRRRIAEDLIEVMISRSEDGVGVYGDPNNPKSLKRRSFPGYSDTYINSLDFKIAGKSPGNVNLTLSGDMLVAIDLLEDRGNKLVIGFEAGSEENARADGNIRGAYGGAPNPRKARPFLGVTADELDSVLKKYKKG
jgi:hypothetical protein